MTEMVKETTKTMAFGMRMYERWLTGMVIPATKAMMPYREVDKKGRTRSTSISYDVMSSALDVMAGKKTPIKHVADMTNKTVSGMRYPQLVHTWGKKLFGSAKFKGERVVAETDLFKLSYIPPAKGAPKPPKEAPMALFHVGGFLPYSDKVLRFLPEANLFKPFVDQGVPVYAMELKPGAESKAGRLTMNKLIDTIAKLSNVAYRKHGHKLVIEGYCGLSTPMLAYLAAKPKEAKRKFGAATMMVAPVDAKACKQIGEVTSNVPETMQRTTRAVAKMRGGSVSGLQAAGGIDLALGTMFDKTLLGYMAEGFKGDGQWARVRRIEQLTPKQRSALAGAYWISLASAARSPIPLEQFELANKLWTEGLPGGRLPAKYKGRQLNLKEISIPVIGLYGQKDKMIPPESGRILAKLLGDKYVQRDIYTGHIGFALSSEKYTNGAFDPNPVQLMRDVYAGKKVEPYAIQQPPPKR